jgi:arylsulfatase
MTGKWHLGMKPEQWPANRGFDKSFALLDGAHNHYGLDQSDQWDSTVLTGSYVENTQITRYPEGEYSTDVFAGRMIDYIRSTPHNRPLFGYLAFTAPHWPLQAPAEDIARYKGAYDGGPAQLRGARIARVKSLGLVNEEAPDAPMLGDWDWESLSDPERAREARKMEVYAAMIHRMDRAIGRVLDTLEAEGRLDNTLIVFLSDNGPDSSSGESVLQMIGVADPTKFGIDNHLEKIGSPRSFVGYGPRWAQASAAAFNRFKGYTTEGGTRVPAIVSGPGIANGRSAAFLHATDLLPTLLDYARSGGRATSARQTGLLEPTGLSMRPILVGKKDGIRMDEQSLGYEFFGGGALWKGHWKLLRLPRPSPLVQYGAQEFEWRLYNLTDDPGEMHDLSGRHPEIRARLLEDWADYISSNNVLVTE